MAYSCRVCGFNHSCWCGGKKCKCGMGLGEAKIAEKLLKEYVIEDKDLMVSLIKEKRSKEYILNKLGLTEGDIKPEQKVDDVIYKKLGMKSIYCEYESFNDNAECKFCGRKRRDGYMKPCLYYLEQNGKLNG